MQKLEQAAMVFCTACICAELTAQLVGDGWARRCIKVVAGLYILVVFVQVLAAAKGELRMFSLPQRQAASFGTQEALLLEETKQTLEQNLARQWETENGTPLALDIALQETDGTLAPVSVQALLPASCTEADCCRAAAFLQEALALPESRVITDRRSGEAVP